jgi:tRNA (guanine37-N1)-methyltransferase
MRITVLTLFPEMFDGFKNTSIIKRAIGKGLVSVEAINIRDYTKDKYGRTDTPPIGGGAGLIEKAQPIVDAIKAVRTPNSKTVLFSPRGATYDEAKAKEYAKLDHLILVCGHYEGVDERVNAYVDELLSIGDYVLTGGEIPAMAVSDSVIRLLDGAIAEESLEDESFNDCLLEYPQYTEPYDFEGATVPDILYSGNHEAISKWRRKQSLLLTKEHRPDLFGKLELSKKDKALLDEDPDETPKWEADAIKKGHKFIKDDKK